MKPYPYRRWRMCYAAARLMGKNPITSAVLAVMAMRLITITNSSYKS